MMTTLAAQSLFQHIQNRDIPAVANFLQNGVINLDERDNDGQTFLMVASQVGCVEIIQVLLEMPNVDVDAVDNDSWTALMNAAKEGNLDIVICLTERNADLERKDTGGWTALIWACYKGRTDVVSELLSRGANPNVRGEHNMSCLTWAAGRGFTEIVRLLLLNGAKPNTSDKYGTTPLMWAARKGYLEIVEFLLEEGALLDNAGMNSWTALIMAAKGGFTEVTHLILDYGPNVNAVDKDSYTALTHAAKEGYVDIVKLLLDKEAYVNRPDRYGDTILIHGTKGGHVEVVKSLLKRHVDMDVQGVDDKTALYWAVEKGHLAIVKLLLDFNANTEIPTKDGDTPLMKSVRSRNLEISKLLLDKGAKASAADKKGDTALHIAVRGRSKRVTELLLRNPKDGRLLYRPNKSGDTPYQLDSEHDKKILTQVFGARNLNADDNIQGYELYSSTIADVLSEPSLNTPITVSLYAKWGSGKSFLIKKLVQEMKNFTQHNTDCLFEFSVLQFFLSFLPSLALGVILALAIRWEVGLGVGLGLLGLQYLFLAIMWVGSVKKNWSWAYFLSVGLAKRLQGLKLLLQVMFCNEPTVTNRETAAVKFLFTDNARLASVVGEKSITAMISTLCDSLEQEYGTMVTRLYKVLRPAKAKDHGRFKCLCCVPYFLIVVFVLCCIITVCVLIYVTGVKDVFDSEIRTVDAVIISFLVIIGVAFLGNIYTWACMAGHLVISPKKRVQKIMSNSDSARMEGMIQSLKKEVELLGQMTRCMDAFLHKHTRLVAIVDGLDSCEQEKLLQVLDTVHMLFSDDKSPFVTILAVDPHVIIKGIEHNLQGLFRDSSINGHDYLRNLVQLPFFLHSQAMPRSRYSVAKPERSTEANLGNPSLAQELSAEKDHGGGIVVHHSTGPGPAGLHAQRQESAISGASSVSIPDINKVSNVKKKRNMTESSTSNYYGSSNLARHASHTDLSKSLGKSSYFSDINPRNMKRMMNIIAVTGRLLRACNVEFNWYKLASWINITEQWPYRLSWIILELESNEEIQETVPLKAVYDMIVPKLPSSKEIDPRLEIDRNEHKLQMFLSSKNPLMTVADLRRFMPCTINVDPYLRKLIKEQIQNAESLNYDLGVFNHPSVASFDNYGWPVAVRRPSSRMEMSPTPRGTPSRPGSSIRLMPPGSGMFSPYGMYPPAAMIPGPFGLGGTTPHPSMVNMAGMAQAQRASPRLNIQGGFPNDPLSMMTVEDICGLLYRLDNLNKMQLPAYINCFQEHNISGPVLMTCELSELKTVLDMTFGDWEVFRTLIHNLRERELSNDVVKPHDPHNAGEDFHDGPQSPRLKFTGDVAPFDSRVQVPKPTYGMADSFKPRRAFSDHVLRDKERSPVNEQYRVKSAHGPKKYGAFPGSKLQVKDNHGHYFPVESLSDPKMARKDSFFGEVMLESAALRSVIEAVGVITDTGEDTEDDVVKGMSPVIEERSPPRRKRSIKHQDHQKKDAGKKSAARKKEQDPRYKVNDSESADSDSESMLLARKHSTKSPKAKSGLPKLKVNSSSVVNLSTDSIPSTVIEAGNKAGSKTSIASSKESHRSRKPPMHRAQTMPENDSDTVHLLATKKGSYTKAGSKDKNKDLNLYLGSDEDIDIAKPTSETSPNATNTEIANAFEDMDRALVGSTEHLALRKLCQPDNVGPSAFKTVTPTSSRASSRASSLGLSLVSSTRGISKEDCLNTSRLSVSDSVEYNPVASSNTSRRSSRKMSPSLGIVSPDSVVIDLSEGMALLAENSQEGLYIDTSGKVSQMTVDDEVTI